MLYGSSVHASKSTETDKRRALLLAGPIKGSAWVPQMSLFENSSLLKKGRKTHLCCGLVVEGWFSSFYPVYMVTLYFRNPRSEKNNSLPPKLAVLKLITVMTNLFITRSLKWWEFSVCLYKGLCSFRVNLYLGFEMCLRLSEKAHAHRSHRQHKGRLILQLERNRSWGRVSR